MTALSLAALLDLIDPPNRAACARILDDNRALFATVPGSTHNHQAWPGGYLDHVHEIMNIALVLHRTLDALRPLPFTVSDALLVVFLHDLEKPWKYELGPDGHLQHVASQRTKDQHHAFRLAKLAAYGVTLTADHDNGLRYVEGELTDYTNRERRMGPLAALCHCADVTSARLWFDHPLPADDPWPGTGRTTT